MRDVLNELKGEINELKAEIQSLRRELVRGKGRTSGEARRTAYKYGAPKQSVTIRLETSLIGRIDTYIAEEMPRSWRATRTDAIRLLIRAGLGGDPKVESR